MLAEYLQHIGKKRDAAAEQDEADQIGRLDVGFAIVRQVAIDQDQAGDADGDVEEEDRAPVEIIDDKAAG